MASVAQLVSFRRAAGYNLLATAGVVMVFIFVLCALFAPLIAPYDPAQIDLPSRLMAPSTSHWFGTDELGRDILSRVIFGARISMLVGSCVVAASLTLGLIFGSIAGYYGGITDRVLNVIVMNAFMSFPGILLAIAFVAFLGPGIVQSDSGAVDRRMGGLCATGARAGAGGARARIRGSRACAGRERPADRRPTHSGPTSFSPSSCRPPSEWRAPFWPKPP